ncbi:MAG: response regulator transcription factor [Thiohalocapsa sp.]|nr:response regulator transcription factor [Thiohalocapsa sp.]MCF7990102.1 response regulator transcription factor [Thiohalocapsa sp.]
MNGSVSSVLIVDDHPLVREGLKGLIADEPGLEVCGETGSMRQAQDMVRQTQPDVVIVDLSLMDGNGLELIRRLKSHYPHIKLLVCSMRDESLFAERAMNAGAHGYINKHEVVGHVVDAIKQVLAGKVYLSPDIVERIISGFAKSQPAGGSSIDDLSNRELEVFWLIGQGKSTAEIAKQLSLSVKTVETHREKIKRKLGLTSAGQLMRHAVQWDLEQG